MTTQTARKLHNRRFSPSPILTTTELVSLIGTDGLQEALDRRWVMPDPETGYLTLNLYGNKLLELESACRCPLCDKTDCQCEPPEAVESTALPENIRSINEAFTAPGLPPPKTQTVTIKTATQVNKTSDNKTGETQPDNNTQNSSDYKTGDAVVVQADNKLYRGQIANIEPDGRVRVRWSQERPAEDRAYAPGEFTVVNEK